MAKRTVGLVLALVTLWTAPAGASEAPQWPCEVPVTIIPGPYAEAAKVAVRQLDAATVISWPIVEADGMLTIQSMPSDLGTHAVTAASDVGLVWAEVNIDLATTPKRLYMTGLLHELGHVAGLDHNDEERSVMNTQDVPWRKFQPVDLDALGDVTCSS